MKYMICTICTYMLLQIIAYNQEKVEHSTSSY